MTVFTAWCEAHLDELGPLLRLRYAADEDRRFTNRSLQDLDRRIAAHLDGLACHDAATLRAHDDALPVVAGLLRLGAPCDDLLAALPPDEVEALRSLGSSALVGSGPRWALLAGRTPDPAWFVDEDPWVRRWAWLLGSAAAPAIEVAPQVRDALRRRRLDWRGGPPHEQIWWDARLATPTQQTEVAARCWAGPRPDFAALAALGRRSDAEALVPWLTSPDLATALAAASAFTIITGADIDGPQRVTVPTPDGSVPDAFDAEFADQAWLPDQALARAALAHLPQASRLNRGVLVSDAQAADDLVLDRCEVVAAALRLTSLRAGGAKLH